MAGVNLTRGAVAMISSGVGEVKPILQVSDLRLVSTRQNSTTERYRMMLSDGTHSQNGMLATQMNHIVKLGRLQKGSIVQLMDFVCNPIQNRKIIIIIGLEVIVEKCDLIGNPKQYVDGADSCPPGSEGRLAIPVRSSPMDQPGIAVDNRQSSGISLTGGPITGRNMTGISPVHLQADSGVTPQPYGGSYTGGSVPGRHVTNGPPLYPKAPKAEPVDSYSDPLQDLGNQNQSLINAGIPYNPYGRPGTPQFTTFQQPPPFYTNRGPVAKNEASTRILPIAALNPYQGRWTIKARVTSKGEIRRYNNPRGEGKVFAFDLLDSDGGEIRVTCFNAVADQFYDQIEAGKVYLISKGSLKPAQKNFNHLNNDYEIFLESTSTIQPCLEDDKSIPRQQFNFRPISEIEGMGSNSMVDVIGIVSSINPSSTIMRKNGTEAQKKTLQLKDMSGRSVELTIWGNFCIAEGQQMQHMCDSGVFPVLAVKACRVNEFNGKSVGTIFTSQLFIDPDFPEAHRLKEWYYREGKNAASLSISRDTSTTGMDIRKTVSQIKDEGLGRSEKPDWITVKAAVLFMKTDNFCYTACPLKLSDRQCCKKVNNNGDGTWHCERCDQSFPECDYRYLLQFQIQDHTGTAWVTAFQESGEEIMGISAKELYLLKYEERDDTKFSEIIRRVLFNQYLFKLKVKEEMFSDEQRIKSTAVKAQRVNSASEVKHLLGFIDKIMDEDSGGSLGRANTSIVSGLGIQQGSQPVGHNLGGNNDFDNGGHKTVDMEVYPLCSSCGDADHNSRDCPRVINDQGHPIVGLSSRVPFDGVDASNKCFKCNQSGHWASDCLGSTAVTSAYGSSSVTGRDGIPKQQLGSF